MKIAVAFSALILLSGCVTVNVDGVRSDGCAWIEPIYLTEPGIKALPREDKLKIASHNAKHEENCPKKDK